MKQFLFVFLSLALLFSLTGCGNGQSASSKTKKASAGVADILEQGMSEANDNQESADIEEVAEGTDRDTAASAKNPAVDYDHIDVDLTVLSATLVYSEVYNMMIVPEEYIGKTIKMKGPFSVYHDDYANKDYFACIIQDATACCAQGMEFAPTDDYTYPDDFPAVDEEICVVGVFDTYEEGGCTYCTLRDATIIP